MKSKLEIIHEYYFTRRRVGHTTAMLNGAKSDPNILVLVANQAQKNYIDLPKRQMISINCIGELRGRKNPIVIDHYALQVMSSEVNLKLKIKDEYIDKLEKLIEKLFYIMVK